jgi:hypothetical protein
LPLILIRRADGILKTRKFYRNRAVPSAICSLAVYSNPQEVDGYDLFSMQNGVHKFWIL